MYSWTVNINSDLFIRCLWQALDSFLSVSKTGCNFRKVMPKCFKGQLHKELTYVVLAKLKCHELISDYTAMQMSMCRFVQSICTLISKISGGPDIF